MRPDGDAVPPAVRLLCGLRRSRIARWADAVAHVVGPSQHVLDVHAGMFDHAEQQVDPKPDAAGRHRPARAEHSPKAIGYIGSLDRIKGVQVLLEAAPELARLGCELRFAGQGRTQADVVAAAERKQACTSTASSVASSKEAFFERCDIGVVPSVWEEPGGPTLAMVEWLAAGRPVLVSRRGGWQKSSTPTPGRSRSIPQPRQSCARSERLLEPERWSDVVGRIRPFDGHRRPGTLG